MRPKLKCKYLSWHRNGISGVGFYIALFNDPETTHEMVVVRFPGSECRTAALSVELLSAAGSSPETRIGFAHGNSWRGDYYEESMLAAIKAHFRKDAKEWKNDDETVAQYVNRNLKEFLADD